KPIPLALSDQEGIVKLNYSKWNSMLAQIIPQDSPSNERSGGQIYFAASNTLDNVIEYLGKPDLIKIDVEGWEVPVFRGALKMLSSDNLSIGICLEWNPEALKQTGNVASDLFQML